MTKMKFSCFSLWSQKFHACTFSIRTWMKFPRVATRMLYVHSPNGISLATDPPIQTFVRSSIARRPHVPKIRNSKETTVERSARWTWMFWWNIIYGVVLFPLTSLWWDAWEFTAGRTTCVFYYVLRQKRNKAAMFDQEKKNRINAWNVNDLFEIYGHAI